MDYAAITRGLILATVAVWVIYSLVMVYLADSKDSASAQMRRWARHPMIPFAVGVVVGHWFWCTCG